ncbi:DUF1345 domain-containing protein [Aureimonas sp. AU20]|uniref:DUF1345 domain-containing protein n=1 Tax=Aureimonas sp. AU20 TaxID=1349819 RepID=UPI001651621E|nr:DUF1345 domain-containing protein [Aureimonas sp. AU20]
MSAPAAPKPRRRRWLAIVRMLRNRPRLLGAVALMVAVFLLLPSDIRVSTRALAGWDSGVLLYLLACGRMMMLADLGRLRARARRQDEGRLAILVVTSLCIAASFGAIAAELHGLGDKASASPGRLTLAGVTVLLSWVVTQFVMALHYAGEYYGDPKSEGGLAFPGKDTEPDYLDFLYFSFTMGAAAQTSDVAVTSRGMRSLVLAHTILAFLFNTTILALAVNVGASVI